MDSSHVRISCRVAYGMAELPCFDHCCLVLYSEEAFCSIFNDVRYKSPLHLDKVRSDLCDGTQTLWNGLVNGERVVIAEERNCASVSPLFELRRHRPRDSEATNPHLAPT